MFSRLHLSHRDKATKRSEKLKKKKNNNPQEQTVPSPAVSATSSKNITATSLTADNVLHSIQTSHVLPTIKSQSDGQITSSIHQSASPVQQTAAAPPLTPFASEASSLPERLWDLAYDHLKADNSTLVLVKAYEKILSYELDMNASNSVASGPQNSTIEQTNPTIRRSQMCRLIQAGLKKTEIGGKEKQGIENIIRIVLSAKDLISHAVRAIPQAALAWTGVCFALQILLNPSKASKANRDGIIYIISRMNWYWNLSSILLKENIDQGGSFIGLQDELETRIIGFYKMILSYQMKSVCFYYRNRGLAFLCDMIMLDDWNGDLKTIQDAENVIQKDCNSYNALQMRSDVKQLIDIQARREDNEALQHLCLTDPNKDMTRIEEIKGGLVKDSYIWIFLNREFTEWRDGDKIQVLWVKGSPGKGKTMLLIGIIRELMSTPDSALLSYFFCQATDSRLNNAAAVLRGLMYQLLKQQRFLISYLREEYDTAGQRLFTDDAFVGLRDIFIKILNDPRLTRVYLIVDALDECESEKSRLLDFINQNTCSRVKWLVSSRPDLQLEIDIKVELILESYPESISEAVNAYIDHKVSELAQKNRYDNKLRDQVREQLHQKANETFLWVALVCQELKKIRKWNALKWLQKVPSDLMLLYDRMMKQIQKSEDKILCMQILSISTIAYRPFHLLELAALADLPQEICNKLENLREIILTCGSFLTIREDTIYFIHQSAKDFLLEKARDEIFVSGVGDMHYTIFSASLGVMNKILRRDMYGLGMPGFPIDKIEQPDLDPLAVAGYSCIYWIDHLCDWDSSKSVKHRHDIQDGVVVDKFLRQKYLYWLEALSLLRNISEGVLSMDKLEELLQGKAEALRLIKLVRDARRFIQYCKWAIENAPLQVYTSALIFSPARSLIRELFKHEEPEWITAKPTMQDDWTSCLQTLEGHSDSVSSVAFSHNSKRLASASKDNTVKIWDAASGQCLQTLEGHRSPVTSVAFSHNSKRIASASEDNKVKIWDAASGQCQQTHEGHRYLIMSVAFSHDSKRLAFGSWDMVKILDTTSGQCLQTFEGHRSSVNSVAFSHDGMRLASASSDDTVKIWDAASGQCLQTLEGHRSSVNSVAFSHDSKRLASASADNTVNIWDVASGQCLQSLEGHRRLVTSVVFSHDNKRLASASYDNMVKIWDVASGRCLQMLEGHRDFVMSVSFSHDSKRLASASWDNMVKIWDAASGQYPQTLEDHLGVVKLVVFSHDNKRLASASTDNTVKIWDATSGQCLQTLEGHRFVFLAGVAFSHDSKRLASASDDNTIRIWDVASGQCLQTLEDLSFRRRIRSVALSHDSKRLASASYGNTVRILDAASGQCLQRLVGHRSLVRSVTFSHDNKRVASASHDNTVKIWDAASGQCLQTFEVSKTLRAILFDITDECLHTEIGAIILDGLPALSTALSTIAYQTPRLQGYGLSSDRIWITFNSENLLWLPPEYRPSTWAPSLTNSVVGSTVAIGCVSGRVLIFNFTNHNNSLNCRQLAETRSC